MHFQKLFFIAGLICSIWSAFSVTDAMDDDSDIVRDRNFDRRSSSYASSSENDSATDDTDSDCGGYESDNSSSASQIDNVPKRLKWTSYHAASEQDPFLREFDTGVYVRAHMKLDGSFDEHPKGTTYMPLAAVEKIEWNWFLSLNDCVLLSRGMSPKVRWLNLANCSLTEVGLGLLDLALSKRATLQELKITEGVENTFSSGAIYHLVSMVTHSPEVKVVEIHNRAITDAAVPMFFGVLVGRQNPLDVLDLGWSITLNGLSHALSFLDIIPSLIRQECSLCMASGDYRTLNSGLIGSILEKNSNLVFSFTFGRGSLVDIASLEALREKYNDGSRYRFNFEVTP